MVTQLESRHSCLCTFLSVRLDEEHLNKPYVFCNLNNASRGLKLKNVQFSCAHRHAYQAGSMPYFKTYVAPCIEYS